VLGGGVVPDAGEVRLDGEALPLGRPVESRRRGLSIIYQELTLAPDLDAAENVFLGRERGTFWLRRGEMRREARALLDRLGAHLDLAAPARTLTVAQQQMVEIARALLERSKVLVLDEPTATLTNAEVERLKAVLRELRGQGLGILYISHRLEEIFDLADRVTVLRDGRRVETARVAGLDRSTLIRWMVGRDVSEEFPPRDGHPGDPVLEVRGLSAPPFFEGVSFDVRRGEIVGLSGLVGAGRTSVALALFGALPATGEVRLEGRAARFRTPREAIDAGLVYVTEDRKGRGLFPLLGAGVNITIAHLAALSRLGVVSRSRDTAAAARAARDFDLRSAGLAQAAGTLSGGNQQKLLLARFLLERCRLLIVDEPTRGIDIGAKAEIYRLLDRLTGEGLAVLMISSELPEILGLSDRVIVIHEGRTRGELPRAEATQERIMDLATGG
jgi:ABC-type sugar transport system ATPase subunit